LADSLGGVYGDRCSLLNPTRVFNQNVYYKNAALSDFGSILDIQVPESIRAKTLKSIALLVKPLNDQTLELKAEAIVKSANGHFIPLSGVCRIPTTGGLILLSGPNGILIHDVRSIEIHFDLPVKIAFINKILGETFDPPMTLWMGS
jgi:hypothetical protein